MSTATRRPMVPPTQRTRWLALGVIALAQLTLALDATIVNIALPTAQRALHFSDGDRQWVITAYTLTFAGLLLLGGRVADLIGRRRAFLIGIAGFAAASGVAGAAPNFAVLAVGRGLQGGFAALLAPTALSLLAVTFTEPAERAKAFAVFGAVASTGAAVGLLAGGALTEYAGWRWCLYVNVALAALIAGAGRAVLAQPPRGGTGGRVGAASAALATGGLAAIVYGAAQAAPHGWSSTSSIMPITAGLALVAAFLARQSVVTDPLLPLAIVTDRRRAGAYLAAVSAVLGSFGVFLMLTYYLQVIEHWSPVRTGLAFLPLVLANTATGTLVGTRLIGRVAPRVLVGGGLAVAAAGLGVLAQLDAGSDYLTGVLPVEILVGAGMGLVFAPAFRLATSGVEHRSAGVAAAMVNVSTQLGASLGTAVLNTVAVAATRAAGTGPAALIHGYAVAAGAAALILAAAAAVCTVLIKE